MSISLWGVDHLRRSQVEHVLYQRCRPDAHWGVDHLRRSQAEEHTGRRAHRSQEKGLTVVDHRFIAQVPFSSLGNAGGIHLDSHKLLAFIAHVGGHGRGLPWLAPIRNSSELRGLYCRSYFGPRTCGRGITNSSKLAGLSIRVSPSHPQNGDL